ncbi:hypothetical protein ACFSKL_07235 [Belliella marina]|uniref:Uncharacterized protein n=1 Tax=Belliella marina TaxID=1644146 RepID=A0ABW4VP73_9BACT
MNRIKQSILTLTLLFIFKLAFAGTPSLTLADSLAKEILENEGLYTVMGGLKPVSTVLQFGFGIDTVTQEYLDGKQVEGKLKEFNKVLSLLENEEIGFALLPFKAVHGDKRIFQIMVYHRESLRQLIAGHDSFFLKRGVLPDMTFPQIIAMVEFGESMERFRAYGYLFGYPDHAVDFFVEASESFNKTKEFVERDFFQIPVSSKAEGHFVYAVPKGYEPQEIDLRLRAKAGQLLESYAYLKSSRKPNEEKYPYLDLYLEMREPENQVSWSKFKNMQDSAESLVQ